MGIKAFLFFAACLTTWVADKFDVLVIDLLNNLISSYDWAIIYVSPEFVVCLIMGICMGYNLWLLWDDQKKILAVLGGVWVIVWGKITH